MALELVFICFQDLNDEQEKTTKSFSMAVARCNPMKNRFPDVMPCMCSCCFFDNVLALVIIFAHKVLVFTFCRP